MAVDLVIDVGNSPGVPADLTRRFARAGVDLDPVYVATRPAARQRSGVSRPIVRTWTRTALAMSAVDHSPVLHNCRAIRRRSSFGIGF